MEINEIMEYCNGKIGVTESFPFGPDALVYKVGGKMFLLLALERQPLVFSAKALPEFSLELREQYPQITGAYHMNKTHWNSVVCEGLRKDLLLKLIDDSYQLVYQSLSKKIKQELEGN